MISLCTIGVYDPALQVPLCLREPIWGPQASRRGVVSEVIAVCHQIESVLRFLTSTSRPLSKEHLAHMNARVAHLQQLAESSLTQLPAPVTLREYVQRPELARLIPRTVRHLAQPPAPVDPGATGDMDAYFGHMSVLNQLAGIASQINSDIRNLANHKYIAHQMALLYQCLSQAPGDLSDFRAQVEEKFAALKAATKASGELLQPVLPPPLADWCLRITDAIANEVLTLACPDFAAPMARVMSAVSAMS